MIKLFKKSDDPKKASWWRQWLREGVRVTTNPSEIGDIAIEYPLLGGYLAQLVDDGLAIESGDGYFLDWDSIYVALSNPSYAALHEVLQFPVQTDAHPKLHSTGSLTDREFSIAIGSWSSKSSDTVDVEIGPILRQGDNQSLMRPQQWALFKEVVAFARRSDRERDDLFHMQAWGRIRRLALAADARLDDFLFRSVVLTPEKLQIGLRRSDVVTDDRVIEVVPMFEDAPAGWLEAFDCSQEVRDQYNIVTPEGIVQVLISPKVRTVLQEIKPLPGRCVAGSRAQAFLLNPYATLGDDATDVIEETQFEKAREDAGLDYERFTPVFKRDTSGYPSRVGLLIETAVSNGPTSSETEWLDDVRLCAFIEALQKAIGHNYQLVAWEGYDLVVDGDAERHLRDMRDALQRRQTPPTLVSYAQVHDLSAYSSRIEGIGVEKPYYSPYIAKKKEDEGWFPENVLPVVVYVPEEGGEPVAVPTTKNEIENLNAKVSDAEEKGDDAVSVPWLPKPITTSEAKRIIKTFNGLFKNLESDKPFDSDKRLPTPADAILGKKKQLVLLANIQSLEYEELRRREALRTIPAEPELPHSIRHGAALLKHQRQGVAWMQHLYRLQSEYQVRGAVLADDMGLGKTFQLLVLMAWLIEKEPDIAPMLIVAPVSLLENWEEEINKFFMPNALPLLTAYGKKLTDLRVPRAQIDQRLLTEDGLVKFLRPDWLGTAKIVLTTYETLRDLEFSFAAQKWSLMVCDEAQRIKNPAAMVTRAAKKQNVGFKIACTGTPVENTLADLWCLFDYVQPGLLGALNDFGSRYRKPIEAKNDEEKARVEELRSKIEPQILRRLKSDVVTDLPRKIIVDECRRLPLSVAQRNLYARSIDSFKKRNDPGSFSPFKNHLGLLHYLRLVCTDPRPHGLTVFKPESPKFYREKAPKLNWLLTKLHEIKAKGEKVIVFCEFREIQRLLQHYIEDEFGIRPDIINGEISAASTHAASRQKRIEAFQKLNGFGVLILSPVAVGFGVNIQAANHVVHYTRTWNPAKEDQATDRAYRIGQKKTVYVYYPVVHADDFVTFDMKLDQLLAYKRGLAEDMLNGSGDVAPGDFNIVDVVPEADVKDIDERVTLDIALKMDWQHFECLAAILWSKQGFNCYRTPGTKDNGVDVVALAGSRGILVQVKSSGTEGTKLSWDAVKEVVAGEAFYRKLHPGVSFDKVCITNQFFNQQAHKNACLNNVKLLDQSHLSTLLAEYEITMLEVEQMLYAEWLEDAGGST
jgi:Holliday junction resolvase